MILTGLDQNRAATVAFIDVAPTTITLYPRTKDSDGTGGWRLVVGAAREPQVFSLLEPGNSGYDLPLVTVDGEQHAIDFMLLGTYDAIIEEDDVFTVDGEKYIVATIMPFNGYERRGLVIKHGW